MVTNFRVRIDFMSLALEVPIICLVTGGVLVRRDRRYVRRCMADVLIRLVLMARSGSQTSSQCFRGCSLQEFFCLLFYYNIRFLEIDLLLQDDN